MTEETAPPENVDRELTVASRFVFRRSPTELAVVKSVLVTRSFQMADAIWVVVGGVVAREYPVLSLFVPTVTGEVTEATAPPANVDRVLTAASMFVFNSSPIELAELKSLPVTRSCQTALAIWAAVGDGVAKTYPALSLFVPTVTGEVTEATAPPENVDRELTVASRFVLRNRPTDPVALKSLLVMTSCQTAVATCDAVGGAAVSE